VCKVIVRGGTVFRSFFPDFFQVNLLFARVKRMRWLLVENRKKLRRRRPEVIAENNKGGGAREYARKGGDNGGARTENRLEKKNVNSYPVDVVCV